MSRENMSRAFATVLSEKLTEVELKDLAAFLVSPLGQKYLRVNNELSNAERFIVPMLREACQGAAARLSADDQRSIASTCGSR